MNTAIIYYSLEGNTRFVCEKIAKELNGETDIIELIPTKAYPDKGFKKFFWGGKSAVMAEKPELQKYDFDAKLRAHCFKSRNSLKEISYFFQKKSYSLKNG